jgi:pyruvate ferredoxin oxidoreductase gamma subunit
MKKKGLIEIIFYARGGQGAKSAAEIVAQATVSDGKFVQAFPSFGPERSGAPTKTFLRIANESIRTREPIVDPDIELILDETLLGDEKKFVGTLIINSDKSEEELREITKCPKKIYAIDANKISMEIVGQLRPNTVILGKLIQIAKIAKIDSVVAEFRKIFEEKIGKSMTDKNLEAIRVAYAANNQ